MRANGTDNPDLLGYGVRAGLAGALCAGIGFALDFDHVGWAAAAALLVMRPSESALELRDRPAGAVLVGAAAAIGLVALAAPRWALGTIVVLVVVMATATARSRWYVTPAFTTFFVFLLLLSGTLRRPRGGSGNAWARRSWVSASPVCSDCCSPVSSTVGPARSRTTPDHDQPSPRSGDAGRRPDPADFSRPGLPDLRARSR